MKKVVNVSYLDETIGEVNEMREALYEIFKYRGEPGLNLEERNQLLRDILKLQRMKTMLVLEEYLVRKKY